MFDDPFLAYLGDALNLIHPRFATRGDQPRALLYELYHQLRHLWDRALPVQLGLGHLLIHPDPESHDLHFQKLGEHGAQNVHLATVTVARLTNSDELDGALTRLARHRKAQPKCKPVCVILGSPAQLPASGLPEVPGVTSLLFDVDRWQVV